MRSYKELNNPCSTTGESWFNLLIACKRLISCISLIFSFGATLLSKIEYSFADEASIPVSISEDVESAVGYIISANSLSPEIQAQIKPLSDGKIVISFNIGDTKSGSAYVSARIKTKSGKVFFTEISDIRPLETVSKMPPLCQRSSKVPFLQSQLESLKSLTENRHTQRGLIKNKIARDLDSGEARRIFNIEKALGLNEQQPISSDTHPIDIIKREFRLLAALKRWEDSKVVKDKPLPPPSKVLE